MIVAIAVLSFLISGVAIGWNIYRDCIDKPKIKVKAYVVEVFSPEELRPEDVLVEMLKINPDQADFINPEALNDWANKLNQPYKGFYIEVINIGKKPIIINSHAFNPKKGEGEPFVIQPLIKDFHNKKLIPYEFFQVCLPFKDLRGLVEKAEEIHSFYVYDTSGKGWKLSDKDLLSLKNDLANLELS